MPVPRQLPDSVCLLASVFKQRADAKERNESAAHLKQVVGTGVSEVRRPVAVYHTHCIITC